MARRRQDIPQPHPEDLRVRDLVNVLESLAPTRFAEPWDNVGLLAGDPGATLRSALLTIDLTADIALEAARQECEAIVAYHPPIFEAVKRFDARHPVAIALQERMAVYAIHTALDSAAGGTNDVLACLAGLDPATTHPLRGVHSGASDSEYKLIVFVPEEALDRVSNALFAAGAGTIGNYSACSFRTAGTGTFYGNAETKPVVGQQGRFERVAEIRLETVLPKARVAAAVEALRASHPYETPAFDLVRLAAAPVAAFGMGRIGTLKRQTSLSALGAHLRKALKASHLLVAGPQRRRVRRVAVCAGAGASLIDDAVKQGADVLVTGEVRHHEALRATAAGLSLICTRHSVSERPALAALAHNLRARLPGIRFHLSKLDCDPYVVV